MGLQRRTNRLLEREAVIAELEDATSQARRGRGVCVVIEGAWGSGRSSLIAEAVRIAAGTGLRVLRATGSDLERDIAWGVAGQLLRPAWREWQPGGPHSRPPDDPDELCRALVTLTNPGARGAAANMAELARGLSSAVTQLSRALRTAGGRGLLIAVDDVHQADRESLRLLAHLARAARGLPICLVLAARSEEPLADAPAAAQLRSHGRRLHAAPLSEAGVAAFVARELPGADPRLPGACARLTSGNPGLLAHVVDGLKSSDSSGRSAALAQLDDVPEPVRESVAARLAGLGEEKRRIIECVAVLGPEATVHRVAALAGVDSDVVLAATESLGRAGLLAAELPLAIVSPLLRAAVLDSLSVFGRARAHLGAARILRAEDADAAMISGQLLDAPADDDAAMIPPLREAAGRALEDDDLEGAAALLRRALDEHPGAELNAELMGDLAWAEAGTRELADEHRLRAVRRDDLPVAIRRRLALAMGRALYAHRRHAVALPYLNVATGAPGAGDDVLLATRVICASLIDELVDEAIEDRDRLLRRRSPGPPPPITRAAVAHTVVRDAFRGASRSEVRALAELAWGDGALLTAGPFVRLGAPLLCAALLLVDELERALEILDAIDAAAPSPWIFAAGDACACVRSWACFLRGDVARGLRGAMDVLRETSTLDAITEAAARTLAALCRLETDRVDAAERLLSEGERAAGGRPLAQALMLAGRSQVSLADHRPQDALDDALEAGRAARGADPAITDDLLGWRSSAALALLSLGERERAQELAREEVTHAAETDNGRRMTRGLSVLGLALAGEGLGLLARAVEVGDLNEPRLAHVHALVEHGAALRRSNRRTESREPLRRGLDRAHRGGARRLEERARAELVASGARPRRPAATGVASLTASQQRVAELAGRGLTTRQMADELFVTPKTVEFHLRETYRKLDVNSRSDLSEALKDT